MNKRKNRSKTLYYIGLLGAICSLIGAEVIWLPAPLTTSGGIQWIEIIDWLYYGLALFPLCWAIGASILLVNEKSSLVIKAVRAGIAVCSCLIIKVIWFAPKSMILLLIFTVATVLLIFVDLLSSEAKERSGFPWKSGRMIVGMVVLLALLLFPTGYNVTYPGMTLNLNRYAHVTGGASGGTINGVLVFDRPAVLADRLFGQLFPLYQFERMQEDEPSISETYAQVIALKTDANRVATAIALEKVGIGKGAVADGVLVVAIMKDSPAEGKLHAGDIIDELNGKPVNEVGEMIAYMEEAVKPGQHVTVEVRRGSEVVSVDIETKLSEQDAKRAAFGVSVQTEVKLDTPREVVFNDYIAHLGGPSHGAMLTLAFIDQLTPGGITGGLHIAGTGTIESDGTIGMVGGIPQKAYAVSRTEADVFFVPVEGAEAAVEAAPGLNVVAVETIDDVLEWVRMNKGG
ncbi:PDZ domain-containing protein [Paenibacillus sp. GSMTC-2017]|uniref:PDZ domain-containing protein n=1 Tax=Paenibacillus sp. GSMTC-2017 TaxID=2794350 RepID=UPI0018D72BC9|nr:PDZ domain-containing protein [Paenibacillus sp. GSMTC-2017]MBH5318240.1 PDZ domain-containing protein [Paenibacillus sp. GSMTC-2017]